MNRAEKNAVVAELGEAFRESPHVILAHFQGLRVNQAVDLRRRIRGVGGGYRVVKNRLARRAAAGLGVERLADRFTGPCAVATHPSDPIALAKAVSDFAKDNPQLEVVAAVVDAAHLVDAAGVKQLAAMPGMPQLRAQLLALLQTPATTLVRLLQTPGTQLARVLAARRDQLEPGEASQAGEKISE